MDAAALPALLQRIVPVEERDGGTAKGDGVQVSVRVFGGRQVPDGDGELCRDGQVGVCDGELQPLAPDPRIFERLVRGLDGHSERLAVGPDLRRHIELKVGAVAGVSTDGCPGLRWALT